MTTSDAGQDHLDLDDLADLSCGEGSGTADAHLAGCEACRRALADLEAAQAPVAAALLLLPLPEPPAGLDARLTAALAREHRTAAASALGSDVVPLAAARHGRDRRPLPGWLGAAAVAVLLVGGLVLLVRQGGGSSSDSAAPASAGAAAAPQVRQLDSGRAYTRDVRTVAAALPGLLAGPTPGPRPGALAALAPLRDPTALAACLSALTPPDQPGLPLAVDHATFVGAPALVVVLPTTRADRVDVYVVGPRCRAADADVLFFTRQAAP